EAGEELKLEDINSERTSSAFDLSLEAVEVGGKLRLAFGYCSKLFHRETVERFAGYFKKAAYAVIENPLIKISDIELLSEEEKKKILVDFNAVTVEYPNGGTIHGLFGEQVEKTPDRIAVFGQPVGLVGNVRPVCLTYRELNQQSGRLAGMLIEKGVLPGTIVGIMMGRSIEMIIGLLGILKSGGAYLPIDPDYPKERIDYMLKDSGAKIKIGRAEDRKIGRSEFVLSSFFPASPLPRFLASDSSNLAYIIYTSGSTGKPKGVLITHRSFVNLIYFRRSIFEENQDSRMSQVANPAFDAMASEVWPCLLSGASLHITDKNHLAPGEMRDWLIQHCITISFQPTVMAEHLLTEIWPDEGVALKSLCAAGDKLNHYPQREYPFKLYNLYGPTEDTVWTTWTLVEKESHPGRSPVIGKPIANHHVYILNTNLKLQPVGLPGELCITGIGLARGYLNNPELTAIKFISVSSVSSVAKIYKTGDLAKWLPDGNIEFLGRIDHQVKIRGFRIELGEIENQLMKYPGVKEAVVLAQEERGDKYLCAYIVSDREHEISVYREYLLLKLPDYMIPSAFVQLEKIPVTPNGKIDRRALPKPGLKAGDNYVAPVNDVERKLVDLWSEVLDRQAHVSIGIDDNFFQLGGHSLNATILAAKIHKEFDVRIPLAEIFKTPTIKELAKYIKEKNKESHISIEPVEDREYYDLSPAQKRLYILQQLVTNNTGYNMPFAITLKENIEKEKLETVFKKLIKRHESLRTSFITVNEMPVQRIHREVEFSIDISNAPGETDINSFLFEFTKPFRLELAPLLRATLVTIGSSRFLIIDMHHIITDGTSQSVLEKECLALLAGETLEPLRFQYKDYSEWYNRVLQQEVIDRQESYWLKEFTGELPVLDLPTDYPRPSIQGIEGNVVSFAFDFEETAALKAIAEKDGLTLYMLLLAIFNVLLAKLSGQDDIIIGTPIAARRHADLANVIGMLVNTMAVRNFPLGGKVLNDFFKEVRNRTLEAYENQEYPFEVLVDKIALERDTSRNPV
ncbi:MAG: hypothetical protein QG657_2089, partial [Acidobacteriota bacterium]|nr:hypothetical protein [Acidobacteriota bacterium]